MPHLSTQGHTLANGILNLDIEAQEIRAVPDERQRTAGTRAQKAKVTKLKMNLTAQE